MQLQCPIFQHSIVAIQVILPIGSEPTNGEGMGPIKYSGKIL